MLMNSRAPRTMTCHCGWCGAVRRLDGTWDSECGSGISQQTSVSQQSSVSQRTNVSEHYPGLVTHGICPDCAAAFRADVAVGHRHQPRVEDQPRVEETFEPAAQAAYLMASF